MVKEDNALISIICPVYNVEKYVAQCIESIRAQTYPHFELLIIDDGSSDRTGELCDRFSRDDQRIITEHIPNQGPAHARNTGLEKARGEYIAFMDGDDYVEPDWLEGMIRHIGDTDLCAVGVVIENEGEAKKPAETDYPAEQLDRKQCFHRIFTGGVAPYLVNKLFRTAMIRGHGLRLDDLTTFCEDAQFLAEYCQYIRNAVLYTKPLYHYVQRQGSIVNSGFHKGLLSFLHGYERIREISEQMGEEPIVDITVCIHCQSVIYRIYYSPEKDQETIRLLQREIRKRRDSLIHYHELKQQRMLCLLMSVSVPLACRILCVYKKQKSA